MQNCKLTKNLGITTLSFNAISRQGCRHGFSTRTGGVSAEPFESLNMGFNRPEPKENILENYRRFCAANRLDFERMALASYAHGLNIQAVTAKDCGRGVLPCLPKLPECDGLITDDPAVILLTLHADCMALFVYDPVRRAIGLAHAGWRGVLGRIGSGLVRRMREAYGCSPKDLIVGLGPGICGDCFEVGAQLVESFEREFGPAAIRSYPDEDTGKGRIDLLACAIRQFSDCDVLPRSIYTSDFCTYEAEELFFSYRRDGKRWGKTGAMCAFMTLGD